MEKLSNTILNFTRNNFKILILLGTSFIILAWGIGGTGILAQGDEAMHIATIRQSFMSKSWILPQLEGSPNYYKPPILFWIGMLSEFFFGKSLFAIRIPAVLAGLGSIFMVYQILTEMKVKALLPAIAYGLSLGTLKFSKLMMMEQFMAFSLIMTCWLFIRFIRTKKPIWIVLAGLVSAIAYFFKGPLFQVYTAFLFLVWASPLLLHFNSAGKFTGLRHMPLVIKAGFLLHIALVIPLTWNLWLYFGSNAGVGRSLLNFFFVIENLSKFGHGNQSALLILQGWLLYSMPWTVLLVGSFILALRTRQKTRANHIGKILLLTALSISLLHMIPNRKDPYYVIPILPLLFTGLPIVLNNVKQNAQVNRMLGKLMNANMVFSGVISFVALIIGLILRLDLFMITLLVIPNLLHLLIWIFQKDHKGSITIHMKRISMLASGTVAMLVLQFIIFPNVNLPLVPVSVRPGLVTKLCLISPHSWDGFDLQMILPHKKISHSMLANSEDCVRHADGVIDLTGKYKPSTSENLQFNAQWQRWFHDPDMTGSKLWSGLMDLSKLQSKIKYYIKIQKISKS